MRFVKKNLKISSGKIAKLKEEYVVSVHPQTKINFLYSKECRAYAPQKKPYLSTRNVKKILNMVNNVFESPNVSGNQLFLLTSQNLFFLFDGCH